MRLARRLGGMSKMDRRFELTHSSRFASLFADANLGLAARAADQAGGGDGLAAGGTWTG